MRLLRAFTLIELLIVVAIIAILAAIAVPNFLEAQVRAKVSRVKNDQRAYATGLEAYLVDNNKYPGDQDNNPFHPTERGLYRLTTPVAYITTLFSDPFSPPFNSADPNAPDVAGFYVMASGSDNVAALLPSQNYVLISLGPDQSDSSDEQDRFPSVCDLGMYDPTNGTTSAGDVLRFGGAYRMGFWRLTGDAKLLPGSIWSNWNPGVTIPN